MKISFSASLEKGPNLWVIPFWEGPKAAAEGVEIPARDFWGKNGETALYYEGEQRILLLGLGPQNQASIEALRKAYSSAVRFAQAKKIKQIDLLFPKCRQKGEFLLGMAEGVFLTNYSFSYKSKEKAHLLGKITFSGIAKTDLVQKIQTICEGVHFVRDLVNANADEKRELFLQAAKKLHPKVKTVLFDQKKLEQEKMGLILAVNRAAETEACLVMASYRGDPKSKDQIVLIGKGITYDTGGLKLKPAEGMITMKSDIAGAATVLGALKTAAELGLKVNVTALMPLAENCIGTKSFKLGDVYGSHAGKTIEIDNTDAEGRLILADALSYAVQNLSPSCMIDLATLTGAAVIALGEEISAFFCNDEPLADELLQSSERTDELIWRLPLHDEYKEMLKSEIADLTNSGAPRREAGAIKAALFLREFAGDIPWAHFDIAGPAFPSKVKHYNPLQGTGYGLRLLVDFLESRAS